MWLLKIENYMHGSCFISIGQHYSGWQKIEELFNDQVKCDSVLDVYEEENGTTLDLLE